MAKLKLVPEATFKAKVAVPVAGEKPVDVEFTFKFLAKAELDVWIKSREGKTDLDSFMDMISGWDLEDEFNAANVTLLLENHIGTPSNALRVYFDELLGARPKL